MNIIQIYQSYNIPINLQQHMLRVAYIAKLICDQLDQSVEVNKSRVLQACLLHDMGNIIKFDLSKTNLLDPIDQNRIEELVKTRQHFLDHFGNNPDEATINIVKEIRLNPAIIKLIEESHWESVHLFSKDDWEKKIVCYADMRIAPHGLELLKNRFKDLMNRRLDAQPKLKILYHQALNMEQEIQSLIHQNLQQISSQEIEAKCAQLQSTQIDML